MDRAAKLFRAAWLYVRIGGGVGGTLSVKLYEAGEEGCEGREGAGLDFGCELDGGRLEGALLLAKVLQPLRGRATTGSSAAATPLQRLSYRRRYPLYHSSSDHTAATQPPRGDEVWK